MEFSNNDLEELIEKSRTCVRLRAPKPLQDGNFAEFQTLINPIQPGSYIRPHKHEFDEVWMHVKGSIGLVLFEDNGYPSEVYGLREGIGGTKLVQVPKNVFHTGFAVQPDSVFFNISKGPFDPKKYKIFSPEWAPDENSPEAKEYLENLQREIAESF